MGSLSNLYISQSYISLIHLGSNNTASATPTELQDGLGNGVGVSVSTDKNLYVSGNIYASNLTGSANDTSSFVTTSSFNAYTQSTNNTIAGLQTTASFNTFSSSNYAVNVSQSQQIAAAFATASAYSASLAASITGSTANVTALSASIYQTDSTQSNNITNLTSKTGSYATTGSNTFNGNQTINGDISSSGTLTVNVISASSAQITYLHTIYESSSVVYSSGSNQLGDQLTDTQILSGSVQIVGGLTLNGVNVSTQSYVDLSSLNSFTASQYVSNSYFATTGSNNFIGDQNVTGSLFVSGGGQVAVQMPGIDFGSTGLGTILTTNEISSNLGATNPFNSTLTLGTYDEAFNYDNEYFFSANSSSLEFKEYNQNLNFAIRTWLKLGASDGTGIKPIQLLRATQITGSFQQTGSTSFSELTGSLASFSASVSSRINSITGSGGGGAVGAITTGSNGQEQSITGSLGINTLNNVLAINSTFTGSTQPAANENTSSTTVYYVTYGNAGNGNPNIFNVDNSGNWSVSGSGVNNQTVTSVNYVDNGVEIEAGGATFTIGENYVFTIGTWENTLSFNNKKFSINTNGGLVQNGDDSGTQPYPNIRTTVNSTTNAGNVYANISIDDVGGPGNGSTNFGLSSNTFTPFGSGLVHSIYGGSQNNLGLGGTEALFLTASNIYLAKDTFLTGSFNVNGTINGNNRIYTSAAITGSAIRIGVASGNQIQFAQPSTGSVNGVNATYYAKDGFQIYRYGSQPYAWSVNLQTNQLTAYTGSEFQWQLLTNGTGTLPGGGGTYFSMASGSNANATGPGADKKGIEYLGTVQLLDFYADSAFRRKVYINNGLYVSQSGGGNPTSSVIINASVGASNKALEVTGSVDFVSASNGNTFSTNLSSSFTGTTDFNNTVKINNGAAFYANGNKQYNIGQFQNNVTLSGSANVSQSIALPVTDISNGVTVANNSQITFTNSGTYNIQFSAQIESNAGADSVYIWFKKNGTNISDSATKVVLANNTAQTMTVNILQSVNANDYIELVWQSANGNAVILSEAASGNIPLIPAVIATVTQVR